MAPLPCPKLPKTDLFINGKWVPPISKEYKPTMNPGNGEVLVKEVAHAGAIDADAAIEAAHVAFQTWSKVSPNERSNLIRKAANILREHAQELALLDAFNTGNPVKEMLSDALIAADNLDYYAGLIPMIRGETIPQPGGGFHYTVRQPLGVAARIIAYNHPGMFCAAKLAAPLAAGCTVVIKPPEQAPLSSLRIAELLADVFPPGVFNIISGGRDCGQRLSVHPLVAKITLIGSVPTGQAIQVAAAASLKPTLLELGGKNALIAFPDADIKRLVQGVVSGMNWTWAGQSCGSMSRVFLHESIHDKVLAEVLPTIKKLYVPGVPSDMDTTMGPLVSTTQRDKVRYYIDSAKQEGATLASGGGPPTTAAIKGGYFIEPTIFTNVKPTMKIAKEEIFGPVMSVFKWSTEEELWPIVNGTQYGLTGAIYTTDLATAQRAVEKIETGYVWVNQVSRHYIGVPFGGQKQSGFGREECLEELIGFTSLKSVHIIP